MENGISRIYYSRNVVNLCIDAYDAERQCGRLWSQYAREPFRFSTLLEALERMEVLYDRLGCPFASTETRSFPGNGSGDSGRKREGRGEGGADGQKTSGGETEPFCRVISHRGRDATFIVRVQYRQDSSWQGEIVWVDSGKRKWFGSVLDLICLIDSALERGKAPDWDAPADNRQ